MKHITQIILFCFFITQFLEAQILKGRIADQSGEAIQYSTIYIPELKQGTTSNTKGNYEIKLPPGKYQVVYQSLGYAPAFAEIFLSDKTVIKDIVLQIQYYEIPEVRITASGEDPAYIIMRKVISLAPYFMNQVSHYKADVYLKGNLVINRIPRLLQRSLKMDVNDTKIKAGDSFLMESMNEIEFNAPDKYVQKVVSFNSNFPEEGNEISPMDFIQASFYQPVLVNMAISPLSPDAFHHYNFKYLGSSLQGNFTINKIQVIPKRKSQQLFSGTIYIIEDLWCLHSVDLTNENLVGKIRIQQLYIPVQDDIWMPVSHKFEVNIDIIGFMAEGGYGSSVKYLDVKSNSSLQKPKTISTNYTGKEAGIPVTADTLVSKTKQKIDRLLSKDELSNRDMAVLSRLVEKESEKSLTDSSGKSLEVTDNIKYIIEKDANKKDSAYWAEIRPIPMSETDIRNLRTSDSTRAKQNLMEFKQDSTGLKKVVKNRFFRTVKEIGLGHTWSDTSGFRFTNGGLLNLKNLSFNTVDGFVYGLDFRISKSWKSSKTFIFSPNVRWAFSRERLMWQINAIYRFNRMCQGQVYLRSGITSKDFNNGGGINPFVNSLTSLLLKENYLKLYESRYFTLGYRRELINGLYLEISGNYDDRRILNNTTGFSFIRSLKEYSDNIPVNKYLIPQKNPGILSDERHADFVTNVTFTPRQKYRINDKVKIPMGSDWPTFNLTWVHGIDEYKALSGGYTYFNKISFDVSRKHETGAFSEYRWLLRTGGFLNNKYVTFYDATHFNTQPFPVLLNNYEDAFMLPAFYSLSTPEFYTEAHAKYTTPYLLIKLLPGLSNTLMRENLSLSYLWSYYQKSYTEIGYSISEFLLLGEIGIYAGFENLRYKNLGAKLVLRFN
jgi:hypothetical protein